jgi:hypothetical protein
MITPMDGIRKKTTAEEHKGRKKKKTLCGWFGRRPRQANKHFHGGHSKTVSAHR